jgi:hypothetical protein
MWSRELPIATVDDALRVIRALGKHRYVAGKLHLVHALAACDVEGELGSWAQGVLDDDSIDKASRDERLVHRATEEEVCALLSHFWTNESSQDALLDRLERFGVDVCSADDEEDIFPVLIDAGWELLKLAELDPERHRGAIEAYGERIHYDVARFEEEEAADPVVHLQELPAIGVSELVRPPVELALWLSGDATYQDYVIRGVLRAARLG